MSIELAKTMKMNHKSQQEMISLLIGVKNIFFDKIGPFKEI